MTKELVLYSRPGCHLCDDMLEQLLAMEGSSGLRIRIVNIDSDPLLLRYYGQRIPVLITADDGRVLSETRLDTDTVRRYLADKPGSRDR